MAKISLNHEFKSSPHRLYGSFLDIDSAKNFLFRTPEGELISAKLDPDVGGEFVFVENRHTGPVEHRGNFVELDPDQKISFAYTIGKDSVDSHFIEIYFSPSGPSGGRIEISQDLESDNAELASQLEQVWSQTLTQLEVYLSQLGDQSLELVTKDSQGQELVEGDTVKTIKDLKVKGSSMVIKRGTVVKKIHLLSGNPEEVDCKVDGVGLTLETQWLLKIH